MVLYASVWDLVFVSAKYCSSVWQQSCHPHLVDIVLNSIYHGLMELCTHSYSMSQHTQPFQFADKMPSLLNLPGELWQIRSTYYISSSSNAPFSDVTQCAMLYQRSALIQGGNLTPVDWHKTQIILVCLHKGSLCTAGQMPYRLFSRYGQSCMTKRL